MRREWPARRRSAQHRHDDRGAARRAHGRPIAEHADFFSFGTNDLTQMTLRALARRRRQVPARYVESGILRDDPFVSIDEDGVGRADASSACDGGRAHAAGPQGRHLRRARRRPAERRASARRSASTTCRARRSACRSRGSRRRRRRRAQPSRSARRGRTMRRAGALARVALRWRSAAAAGRPFGRRAARAARRIPRFGIELVDDAAVLEFHERASAFYGRLAHRRFNSIETFRTRCCASSSAPSALLGLLRRLAQEPDDAHFEQNRPLALEVLEFRFEGPGRRAGRDPHHGRERPAAAARHRATSTARTAGSAVDGTWWIVPGRGSEARAGSLVSLSV